MNKKIEGWNYLDKPKYNWYCPKCKFLTCVATHFDNENIVYTDVYKSCSASANEFIMVFSNEPGDYCSSITMNSLFAHYISDVHGYRITEKIIVV